MLKLLFKYYRKEIEDVLIEEILGRRPDGKEPAFTVLQNNRDVSEKWLLWNAWYVQKKLANEKDEKEQERLKGVLLHIRVLLALTAKAAAKKVAPKEVKEEKDPHEGVKKFMEGWKKA